MSADRVADALRSVIIAIDAHDSATFAAWERLTSDTAHAERELRSACTAAIETLTRELGVELDD